jgi:hypothetical protein
MARNVPPSAYEITFQIGHKMLTKLTIIIIPATILVFIYTRQTCKTDALPPSPCCDKPADIQSATYSTELPRLLSDVLNLDSEATSAHIEPLYYSLSEILKKKEGPSSLVALTTAILIPHASIKLPSRAIRNLRRHFDPMIYELAENYPNPNGKCELATAITLAIAHNDMNLTLPIATKVIQNQKIERTCPNIDNKTQDELVKLANKYSISLGK